MAKALKKLLAHYIVCASVCVCVVCVVLESLWNRKPGSKAEWMGSIYSLSSLFSLWLRGKVMSDSELEKEEQVLRYTVCVCVCVLFLFSSLGWTPPALQFSRGS